MVHRSVDGAGKLTLAHDENRTGFVVFNKSLTLNVTVTVDGEPVITVLPNTLIQVPDRAKVLIEGASNQTDFEVFEWNPERDK